MDMKIFSAKVNQLISSYNKVQTEAAEDDEKSKTNQADFVNKAKELDKELAEARGGIQHLEMDLRYSRDRLGMFLSEVKKGETSISIPDIDSDAISDQAKLSRLRSP